MAASRNGRYRAKVLPATIEDVEALLRTGLRQADIDEMAALRRDHREALVQGFEVSDIAFTVFADGEACAMFGVASDFEIGIPWLLATPLFETLRREIVVDGPRWVALLCSLYPVLQNYVDARNTTAIGWLQRMGFKFPGDQRPSPTGVPFRRFTHV